MTSHPSPESVRLSEFMARHRPMVAYIAREASGRVMGRASTVELTTVGEKALRQVGEELCAAPHDADHVDRMAAHVHRRVRAAVTDHLYRAYGGVVATGMRGASAADVDVTTSAGSATATSEATAENSIPVVAASGSSTHSGVEGVGSVASAQGSGTAGHIAGIGAPSEGAGASAAVGAPVANPAGWMPAPVAESGPQAGDGATSPASRSHTVAAEHGPSSPQSVAGTAHGGAGHLGAGGAGVLRSSGTPHGLNTGRGGADHAGTAYETAAAGTAHGVGDDADPVLVQDAALADAREPHVWVTSETAALARGAVMDLWLANMVESVTGQAPISGRRPPVPSRSGRGGAVVSGTGSGSSGVGAGMAQPGVPQQAAVRDGSDEPAAAYKRFL